MLLVLTKHSLQSFLDFDVKSVQCETLLLKFQKQSQQYIFSSAIVCQIVEQTYSSYLIFQNMHLTTLTGYFRHISLKVS